MILVRNVFQVRFGKAKEATALWKEGLAISRRAGWPAEKARILTDLSGVPFYTLVFEVEFASLAEYERASSTLMAGPEWQAWYAQVVPLMEGGHREILTVAQ